jgi:hypothetical protein
MHLYWQASHGLSTQIRLPQSVVLPDRAVDLGLGIGKRPFRRLALPMSSKKALKPCSTRRDSS